MFRYVVLPVPVRVERRGEELWTSESGERGGSASRDMCVPDVRHRGRTYILTSLGGDGPGDSGREQAASVVVWRCRANRRVLAWHIRF